MVIEKHIGRPTKLTPELQEKIVGHVKNCNYPSTSAVACGVDESTFYRWMNRAQEGEEPYASFAIAVKKAEAESQVDLVGIVRKAAPDKWQAGMTLAERRWPEQFAQVERSAGNQSDLARGIEILGKLAEMVRPKVIEGEVKEIKEGTD